MDIRFNIPEPLIYRYECRMTQKARPSHIWNCASKPAAPLAGSEVNGSLIYGEDELVEATLPRKTSVTR